MLIQHLHPFTYPIIWCSFIGWFLLAAANCSGQSSTHKEEMVFVVVEQPPEFPGGRQALYQYLSNNVQMPAEAIKAKISDRVIISFVVEIDGELTDFQFVRSWGYGCDEEAMRVVKAMPRWKPGSQSGRLLRVKYTLSVLFGLDYPKFKAH